MAFLSRLKRLKVKTGSAAPKRRPGIDPKTDPGWPSYGPGPEGPKHRKFVSGFFAVSFLGDGGGIWYIERGGNSTTNNAFCLLRVSSHLECHLARLVRKAGGRSY